MAIFAYKTKNGSVPTREQRKVYFTCHPEDFDRCFPKITEDILATHNCAIIYTEDMTAPIPAADREAYLEKMSLFVVPVTRRLLSQPSRAMQSDIAYAKANGVRILPFMMESDIDYLYGKAENFGPRQYLNPFSSDLTEIRYEDKLKKFLDTVLISDETVERIQKTFDACIFLSYRKKDRRYANRLMKQIHKIPKFRDIAIWYDEFLPLGVDFRTNIQDALDRSRLFVMAVTPSLLEPNADGKPNYVMAEEYPLARRKKGKKAIFPVELQPTPRRLLRKKFRGIPESAAPEALELPLTLSLSQNGVRFLSKAYDPEHNYLMGMAYMEGIDVEVDRQRGFALILSAAEAGWPEAMERLYELYRNDPGSSNKEHFHWKEHHWNAYVWAQRLAEHCQKQYGQQDSRTIDALQRVADALDALDFGEKALELLEQVYALRCAAGGETDEAAMAALYRLAEVHLRREQPLQAIRAFRKVYAQRCQVLGAEHRDTLAALRSIATFYQHHRNFPAAAETLEQLLTRCSAFDHTGKYACSIQRLLAQIYGKMGQSEKAHALLEATFARQWEGVSKYRHDRLEAQQQLASDYELIGSYTKALSVMEELHATRCEANGEAAPETLKAQLELVSLSMMARDCEKAVASFEQWHSIARNVDNADNDLAISYLHSLGIACLELDNQPQNLALKKRVHALQCALLGEAHTDTLRMRRAITAAEAPPDDTSTS